MPIVFFPEIKFVTAPKITQKQLSEFSTAVQFCIISYFVAKTLSKIIYRP